jgi:outer membrane protein
MRRKITPSWAGLAANACLALAAFTPWASAQTLPEALDAAARNNPTLLEAQLGVRSAGESRWQARADYLPSVHVTHSVGQSQNETTLGATTIDEELEPENTNVRITQEIYTGGRRRSQMQLSRATVEGARHSLSLTEQSVVLDVVSAYVAVRRDEEIVRARVAYLEGLREQVQGTRRRLDVGEVTVTDLALTEARLAGANALLSEARSAFDSSRARFTQATGLVAQSLEAPVAPGELPLTLEEAVGRAENIHPALLRADEDERAARARVGIERSSLMPQVSIIGQANRQEEASTPGEVERGDSAVAQVSVPLFEGGYRRSRLRQSRFDLSRAEARREETRRQVVANVTERWSAMQSARQVRAAAVTRSAANQQAVAGAERELGMGLRSTLDVLNTREEWQEARVAQARAEADEIVAAYALLAATGQLRLETSPAHD